MPLWPGQPSSSRVRATSPHPTGWRSPVALSSLGGSRQIGPRSRPTHSLTLQLSSPVTACSSRERCSIVPEKAPKRFSRAEILKALQALGDELSGRGVRGQIFIVGGASMALAYSTRRVTKDIDAVFEPKSSIYEAAAKVAEELGLPEDWLNDAANGFMPGEDHNARPVPDIKGIEITTASPQYLLTMKLMPMRFGAENENTE